MKRFNVHTHSPAFVESDEGEYVKASDASAIEEELDAAIARAERAEAELLKVKTWRDEDKEMANKWKALCDVRLVERNDSRKAHAEAVDLLIKAKAVMPIPATRGGGTVSQSAGWDETVVKKIHDEISVAIARHKDAGK